MNMDEKDLSRAQSLKDLCPKPENYTRSDLQKMLETYDKTKLRIGMKTAQKTLQYKSLKSGFGDPLQKTSQKK